MIDNDILKKAFLLARTGKIEEAEKIYQACINENPNNAALLSVYGLMYVSVKNYKRASEVLRQACELNETFGTLSALGVAEYEQGNYIEAAQILEKSLKYGENPDVYDKLIMCLYELNLYNKAAEYSQKMYELYPDNINAIANMVKTLTHSGKMLEAEKLCTETLKNNSESPLLWVHLGYLKELIYCDDKQAKECYKIAENLGAKNALYNIGVSCYKLGQYEEAEKYYKKMLEYCPGSEETTTSLGMCYLKQRKFKEGYDLFFQRNKKLYAEVSNNFWKPGDDIQDEINIICDQGYGDAIQFIRYILFLKNKKIHIGVRKALRRLFEINYPNIDFRDIEDLSSDLQTFFITDLAYVLDVDFNNIPFSEKYLKAEPSEIQSSKLKVGFCWEAGSAGIRTMINRTINIKLFEKMLNLENVQIYSFQVIDSLNGNEKYPQMINLAKDFKDFYDTASSLMAMDVVVTVDTGLAHLCGALGIKTYLFLPHVNDWRWFNDTKITPWYKSIEIIYQKNNMSWENEIDEVICRLSQQN